MMGSINTFWFLIKKRDWESVFETIDIKIHKRQYQDKFDPIEPLDGNTKLSGKTKIAVYTCITGGYDSPSPPKLIDEGYDFYLFTDCENMVCDGWNTIYIDKDHFRELSNSQINRYLKLHPHEFFKDYDYSVYIDGNVMITKDIRGFFEQFGESFLGVHTHPLRNCIYTEANLLLKMRRFKVIHEMIKEQMNEYRNNGFPEHFGLFENTVLLRKHNDARCIELMNAWWKQMVIYPTRDQLSLPYVMFTLKISSKTIAIIGGDVKNSVYFQYKKHG